MKSTLLILFSLSIIGCSTPTLQIGEKEEIWVVNNKSFLNLFFWTEVRFCRAKKSEDGSKVDPTCYEANDLERRQVHPDYIKKIDSSTPFSR